jgi:uncharacterized protein involved in response to NO
VRTAFLERGFRPFFLLGALHAALAAAQWAAVLAGHRAPPQWIGATLWHAHEMLFGIASAAIAGFLLTAVPNWTGRPAVAGPRLLALVLLWVGGRVAFATPDRWPPLAIAALDAAFLPALALAITPSIVAARAARNYVVPVLVLALGAANALVLAEALGWVAGVASSALRIGVLLVAALVTLIGGRIVPVFTANALRHAGGAAPMPAPGLADRVALPAVLGCAALSPFASAQTARGVVAGIAAVALAARLARWQGHRALRDPLVWSMHLGYAWLPIGFALLALADLARVVPELAGLHALAAGAFGTMILAVASRVALGHTGRPLRASPSAVCAYALVTAGAVLRVTSAITPLPWLPVAGALWASAFAVFALGHARMLVTPRADAAASA